MTHHLFDPDYIRRLRNGDPVVEDHFSTYFGDLLWLKLRARLRSKQLILDVRQETLLRVLEILREKQGVAHPESFGAFVNSVCNNVLLEALRAEGRHEAIDDVDVRDPMIDLDAPLVRDDLKRQISRTLEDLPPKDRELLQAVYLDEAEKDEVCRRYQVNGEYLRVLLHRAKARFRKAYLRHARKRSELCV